MKFKKFLPNRVKPKIILITEDNLGFEGGSVMQAIGSKIVQENLSQH